MTVMKRRWTFIVSLSLIVGCSGGLTSREASTPPTLAEATTTPAPSTSTTTTTTTTVAPATTIETTAPIQPQEVEASPRDLYGKCGEWRDLAIAVGWPEEEWPTLSYVLHRESRCTSDAHNASDPSSGSRGLLQINGFWCRPSKYSVAGWLQERGVLETCDDLYDPETNLRAGLNIWIYGELKHGCGWRGPWATACR